jgi:hypothetical protein
MHPATANGSTSCWSNAEPYIQGTNHQRKIMKAFKYAYSTCRLTWLTIFIFISIGLKAQPGGSDDLGADPDSAVPVDGGITLLLAAGLGYGARKAARYRMQRSK